MSGQGDLERIRTYATGELSGAEREAFRERLAREPELAELCAAYEAVVQATPESAPAPRTAFEDLALSPPGGVSRRRWLAAAAVLLVAAGLWLVFGGGRRPPPAVGLRSIPLSAVALDGDAPFGLVARLARHRVADENGLVWTRDLAAGEELARFTDRPVLLFIDHPTCPICARYEKGPFRDARVARAAAHFVLVRLSWDAAPKDLLRDPNAGWPLFRALDRKRRVLAGFSGYRTAPDLARWLEQVADDARKAGSFAIPRLDRLQALAVRLADADAESSAARTWEIRRLVEASDPDGPFGRVARARHAETLAAARSELLRAREEPADAALARLERAARRYAGTPPGRDLARVARHLRQTGVFPGLRR